MDNKIKNPYHFSNEETHEKIRKTIKKINKYKLENYQEQFLQWLITEGLIIIFNTQNNIDLDINIYDDYEKALKNYISIKYNDDVDLLYTKFRYDFETNPFNIIDIESIYNKSNFYTNYFIMNIYYNNITLYNILYNVTKLKKDKYNTEIIKKNKKLEETNQKLVEQLRKVAHIPDFHINRNKKSRGEFQYSHSDFLYDKRHMPHDEHEPEQYSTLQEILNKRQRKQEQKRKQKREQEQNQEQDIYKKKFIKYYLKNFFLNNQ
jgi:hypothetical protein